MRALRGEFRGGGGAGACGDGCRHVGDILYLFFDLVVAAEIWEAGAEEEHTGDSHDPHLKAGGFGQKDEYTNWLTADLAAADAARKATGYPRWIVAGGHRPQDDIIGIHTDLFQKYKVDLYVSGIERTL